MIHEPYLPARLLVSLPPERRRELSSMFLLTDDEAADVGTHYSGSTLSSWLQQTPVLMADLSDIPLRVAADDWCIAALLAPRKPYDLLISRHGLLEPGHPWGVPPSATLLLSSEVQASQFHELAPQINVVVTQDATGSIIQALSTGAADAAVIPSVSVAEEWIQSRGLTSKPLHYREWVTASGRGAIACLCLADDSLTRRRLQRMHARDVAVSTNVERTLLRYLPEQDRSGLAAYCHTDHRAQYHLSVWHQALGIKKTLSYSTTAGLAEAMWHVIQQSQ